MVGHAVLDSAPQALPACITAARGLGDSIDVLITGYGAVNGAAAAVSKLDGVSSVICADHPGLEHELAEPVARLVAEVIKKCAHNCMCQWLQGHAGCQKSPSDSSHRVNTIVQKEIQQLHHAGHHFREEHSAKSSCIAGVSTHLRCDCCRI